MCGYNTLVSNVWLGLGLYDLCLGLKHPALASGSTISAFVSNLCLGLGVSDLCLSLKPSASAFGTMVSAWSQTSASALYSVISAWSQSSASASSSMISTLVSNLWLCHAFYNYLSWPQTSSLVNIPVNRHSHSWKGRITEYEIVYDINVLMMWTVSSRK